VIALRESECCALARTNYRSVTRRSAGREKEHHNPDGMIALCGEHHDKADAGAFTREQLGRMKQDGRAHAAEVRGRFEWMRRELLGVVGGSFYHETPILVQFRDEPMIWFNRDESGYLLLNVRMLTASKEPRLRVEDNYWITRGNPETSNVRHPASGSVHATAQGTTSQLSSSS